MPLADLVRNLNSSRWRAIAGLDPGMPFVSAGGGVYVHYAGLRLASRFLPYLETSSGRVLGHVAELIASGLDRRAQLEPEAVFALPTDGAELVYLDRLVRTLHALNYLTQPLRGSLLLKVHPRHITGVAADHGLAFEEIIRPCGLVPAQITLEVTARGIEDREHFKRAAANYRSRGYGIALGHFGLEAADFELLDEIRPDIVRLHPALLASGRPLRRLIERVHAGNCLSLASAHALPQAHESIAAVDLVTAGRSGRHRRHPHASPPLGF